MSILTVRRSVVVLVLPGGPVASARACRVDVDHVFIWGRHEGRRLVSVGVLGEKDTVTY